jgi:hypothetical protein
MSFLSENLCIYIVCLDVHAKILFWIFWYFKICVLIIGLFAPVSQNEYPERNALLLVVSWVFESPAAHLASLVWSSMGDRCRVATCTKKKDLLRQYGRRTIPPSPAPAAKRFPNQVGKLPAALSDPLRFSSAQTQPRRPSKCQRRTAGVTTTDGDDDRRSIGLVCPRHPPF